MVDSWIHFAVKRKIRKDKKQKLVTGFSELETSKLDGFIRNPPPPPLLLQVCTKLWLSIYVKEISTINRAFQTNINYIPYIL